MHSGSRRIGTHVANVNILRSNVYKQVCVHLRMFYFEISAVFAAEFDCSGFQNSSTGSVKKKIDESCAGGKEIENRSIASNQDDGPNDHGDEEWESSASKGWSIELKYMPSFLLKNNEMTNLLTMQRGCRIKLHRKLIATNSKDINYGRRAMSPA